MLKVSAKLFFPLCLLLLLTASLSPAAGTAQTTPPTPSQPPVPTIKVPSGSYMLSCYSCQCGKPQSNSSYPEMVSTTIDLTTCTVDSDGYYNLTNTYGKLVCSTT